MSTTRILVIFVLLGMVSLLPKVAAADGAYELRFIPTHNAPEGAEGVMRIFVRDGHSVVRLRVRGLYPSTVYTIWTVFNKLTWKPSDPPSGHSIPSCPANGVFSKPEDRTACEAALVPAATWNGWANFPVEGNGVAPTAKMSTRFTDGMGLDPGATFTTDENGNGRVSVQLDYDILANDQETGPPIGNADVIRQTVPVVTCDPDASGKLTTTCTKKSLRVTTTYLRKFVAEEPLAARAEKCANYDPKSDPENAAYDLEHASGADARLWQCVDPATNLPRVPRAGFDHFRLANHPDELTHGFIGGNSADHWIDMVGRREDINPRGSSAAPVTPLVPR